MTVEEGVDFLAERRRTILPGGMAMILHGLDRYTKDCDIWLDPWPDPETWAAAIEELLTQEPSLKPRRIDPLSPGGWAVVEAAAVAKTGGEDGLVRVVGADRPIDIFYKPNDPTSRKRGTEVRR